MEPSSENSAWFDAQLAEDGVGVLAEGWHRA
jgi:hypothetical protein